ncbi:MAG: polysaccharide deacetylase family protein [Coriobacteriia bacterium]|nr:polysaccharide deacetylase family protein [Coriobacteriia bacterium]
MKITRRVAACVAVTGLLVLSAAFGLVVALGTIRTHYVFTAVPVRQPVIALTFDDGPHPEYTPRMLDDLEVRDVVATFFVVGEEAEKCPAVLERIVAAGHEVGNHTYTHDHVELLDGDAFVAEISACDAVISCVTGADCTWYRPPRGRLPLTQEWSVVGSGKRIAGWTQCLEASAYRDPLVLADALVPGDIVLVHDGRLDRSKSADMLPVFLDAAIERGFRFVTLSELDSMRVVRPTMSVMLGHP